MKKLLSILAIALCFAACQNDGIKEVSNGDFVDVVLKVDAPELSVTRADGDALAGKNSAYGAIDFMNDEDWAKNDLRYILEVYDENDAGDGEAIYCERLVKCQDKYSPIQFELRLVPNRNYKFVVFADFVAEGSAEADTINDLYYDTTDLRNITAKTDVEGWNAMNELRDAYFVSTNLLVENSVTQDIILTRPFAKLRVITTDLNYITGYSKPGYVEVEYYNEDVFNSFNAVNGNLNTTTLSGDALKYKYVVKKDAPYTAGHDAEANSQTLFADYVFAKEDSQIPVNFKMTVYEDATKAKKIHEQDFSTQIPVQRNHLTTLIGNMLTTEANVYIYINDNFDEPELINPTLDTIEKPVVTAEADGNKVTISWAAVEGAAKYYTRIVDAGNTFEETTELSKVYENLAWDTTYKFEVYAVKANGLASEHAFAEATTGEEPIVITALAKPVVTGVANGLEITLTLQSVENAAEFEITVDGDTQKVELPVETYTYSATQYNTKYTFEIVAVPSDTAHYSRSEACIVEVTTGEESTGDEPEVNTPEAGTELTVAEFLAYANTEVAYQLTGVISNVTNRTKGNFDLTDATGTIFVYGVLNSTGGTDGAMDESGLRVGDTVTLEGKYKDYNGKPEIISTILKNHVAIPFIEAEGTTVNADETMATIKVTSNVDWAVTCDATWVTDYTTSGSNVDYIEIDLEANVFEESRTATFTLTADGVQQPVTVTLTQNGAGTTDTKGTYSNEAFFVKNDSVNTTNKSYFEKINIDGTSYDCLKLGNSSSAGTYTSNAVNESGDLTLSFYALGWKDKTSTMEVYVNDTKIGDTITLKANAGATNQTPYTATVDDATDYYTLRLTGVTEESTIKFTSTNKSRVIIFGVQLY